VDFDAMSHNLGNHLHCSHAIAHGQNNASQVDKHDKHILTESESENLAKTSRIPHSSTARMERQGGLELRSADEIKLTRYTLFTSGAMNYLNYQ